MAVRKIKTIKGEKTPNIILISPTWKTAQEATAGELTEAIQERLGCNAIIYEEARISKAGEKKEPGENLYDLRNAEAHPTFIPEITEMISDPENTAVFWIRDIQSEKLAEESNKWGYQDAKCLVGYGQGAGGGITMDPEKVKRLVQLLNDHELASVETHEESSDFRGANPETMNQYFKNKIENFPGVQSVELNFSQEHIKGASKAKKTSVKVAKAIALMLGYITDQIQEKEVDENLVREATERVMEFIATNHRNNVAVGHYMIEKFYGNDYVKAKKGRKSKKNPSMQCLINLKRQAILHQNRGSIML
jgi:hypothetical protein